MLKFDADILLFRALRKVKNVNISKGGSKGPSFQRELLSPRTSSQKIEDLKLKEKVIDGFLDNIFNFKITIDNLLNNSSTGENRSKTEVVENTRTASFNKTKLLREVEEDIKSKEAIIDNFLDSILMGAPETTVTPAPSPKVSAALNDVNPENSLLSGQDSSTASTESSISSSVTTSSSTDGDTMPASSLGKVRIVKTTTTVSSIQALKLKEMESVSKFPLPVTEASTASTHPKKPEVTKQEATLILKETTTSPAVGESTTELTERTNILESTIAPQVSSTGTIPTLPSSTSTEENFSTAESLTFRNVKLEDTDFVTQFQFPVTVAPTSLSSTETIVSDSRRSEVAKEDVDGTILARATTLPIVQETKVEVTEKSAFV